MGSDPSRCFCLSPTDTFGYDRAMNRSSPPLARATFVALASLALGACAAPRDPELERHVIRHRLNVAQKVEAPSEPTPPPPAAPPAPALAVKTYSNAELTRFFAAVPGVGARLTATLETAQGSITCVLEDQRAPQTTANFVALATGQTAFRTADSGPPQTRPFYDGLTFHRALDNFIIQAGNPTGRFNAGPGWRITRETGANDLFEKEGVLAMIDDGDATHGSQFFITVRADRSLANRYAAFGRCDNPELVRAIANAEKRPTTEGKPSTPVAPVRIERLVIGRAAE